MQTSLALSKDDDKGKDDESFFKPCDDITKKPEEDKAIAEHVAAKCDPPAEKPAEDACESDDKQPAGKDKAATTGGKDLGAVLGKRREGVIHAVIGPVIDVYFPEEIPDVMNAMEVVDAPVEHLVLEVRLPLINYLSFEA